jgi:hypothetical protein
LPRFYPENMSVFKWNVGLSNRHRLKYNTTEHYSCWMSNLMDNRVYWLKHAKIQFSITPYAILSSKNRWGVSWNSKSSKYCQASFYLHFLWCLSKIIYSNACRVSFANTSVVQTLKCSSWFECSWSSYEIKFDVQDKKLEMILPKIKIFSFLCNLLW